MTGRPARGGRARRGVCEGAGPVPHRRPPGADLQRVAQPRPRRRWSRRWPDRSVRRIASPSSDLRDTFRGAFPNGLHTHADGTPTSTSPGRPAGREGTIDEASDESFPASDPPSYTPRPRSRAERRAGAAATRCPSRLPEGAHYKAVEVAARRRAASVRDRVRGDRRHHVLHEHEQPDGHGGRRAAGPKRRRSRP